MESKIIAFHGDEKLQSVDIQNMNTGEEYSSEVDGVFIFIGYQPNTEFLRNQIELNSNGEIMVDGNMQTNLSGVFAAGDSNAKRYRQVTTAVADGTIAALAAADFLNHKKALSKNKTSIQYS